MPCVPHAPAVRRRLSLDPLGLLRGSRAGVPPSSSYPEPRRRRGGFSLPLSFFPHALAEIMSFAPLPCLAALGRFSSFSLREGPRDLLGAGFPISSRAYSVGLVERRCYFPRFFVSGFLHEEPLLCGFVLGVACHWVSPWLSSGLGG